MAQRKAPQNKNAGAAPENKSPKEDEKPDALTEFVDRDSQLRRLLKAENHEWVGTLGRLELRNIADRIREELRGEVEVEEEDPHE